MDIMQEIDRRIVFWDGGMGSLLQERGLRPGELPETWNILHPDIGTAKTCTSGQWWRRLPGIWRKPTI